ncbi:hypothetical protein QVD17_38101 [Tagetes erecta]|uniref:Uncharacterized protein n=1 Tax=Tagetes erecta TaxID=13708 RepID=A0AAD8JZH5_TARER|nr:hypothetical protein QVD17_38101 [Tagetes erecta]
MNSSTSNKYKGSNVPCFHCGAPTIIRCLFKIAILICTFYERHQPEKEVEVVIVVENEEDPKMNPDMYEDPEVLKTAYVYDSPEKKVEITDYFDPYPGEHSSDSDWSNDDCHWK